MGSLERLFLRITPIIMLICFICFGVTYTFDPNERNNLTYLSKENIQYTIYERNQNTNQIEEITKTQQIYTFDMQSYMNNINVNILKNATSNTINWNAWQNNSNQFRSIWQDGYQAGDVLKTIVNVLLQGINGIFAIINIIFIPVRVIAGLLLTAFSVTGINISRNTPLITALKTILNKFAIPLFNPTGTKQEYQGSAEQLEGIWEITRPNATNYAYYEFNFYGYHTEELYKAIKIENGTITYIKYSTNEEIIVYENGNWSPNEQYDVIDIGQGIPNTYQVLQFMQTIADKWDE